MNKYKNLKSYKTDELDSKKIFVESSMVLPDFKPDIKNVLMTKPKCKITQKKTIKDKVHLTGGVEAKVVYASDDDDNQVNSLKWHDDFREQVQLKEALDAYHLEIIPSIESVDVEIINERKILIRMVVEIKMIAHKKNDVKILCENDDDMQIKTKSISYQASEYIDNFMGEIKDFFTIKKENNDINEIIDMQGTLMIDTSDMSDDKIMIGGKAYITMVYSTEDIRNPIKTKRHSFDFSHIIEGKPMSENMTPSIKAEVDSIMVETDMQDSGNMTITITMNIEGEVFGNIDEETDVVIDAFSPNFDADLVVSPLEYMLKSEELKTEIFVKEDVSLKESMPDIYRICHVDVEPIDFYITEKDDDVALQGEVMIKAVYMSDDDTMDLYKFTETAEIERVLPIDIDMNGKTERIDVNIFECDGEVFGKRDMSIRCKIDADIDIVETIKENIITDLKKGKDIEKNNSSIKIYFTNDTDDLWSIAKKYHTSVDALKETNKIDDAMPKYLIIR